jgi:hypothetical protein
VSETVDLFLELAALPTPPGEERAISAGFGVAAGEPIAD